MLAILAGKKYVYISIIVFITFRKKWDEKLIDERDEGGVKMKEVKPYIKGVVESACVI